MLISDALNFRKQIIMVLDFSIWQVLAVFLGRPEC